MKTAANANRRGTVTQVDEVLMIRLNIHPAFFRLENFPDCQVETILVYLLRNVLSPEAAFSNLRSNSLPLCACLV
jgi:hypothetical protein